MNDFTKEEKLYFMEFRNCECLMKQVLIAKDFSLDIPDYKWQTFRILGKNRNEAIDELIAKLEFLKEYKEETNE